MTAPRFGPGDKWPSHKEAYWRQTLDAARQAGWTLTYIGSSHNFGVLSCPAGEHTFTVFHTGNGAENPAKDAGRKIRRCEHPPEGPIGEQWDRSSELLDVAEKITDDAEYGLARAEAKQHAQEVLECLEVQLDTAASTIKEVLLAEQEQALEAAIAVDDAPDPPALLEKLNQATDAVDRGEFAAKSVKGKRPGVAKPLLTRAKSLHARISESRSRLVVLQEKSEADSQ